MARLMQPSEVEDRARFLMRRHGKVTTQELVRFCAGGVDPQDAAGVLKAIFNEIGPGTFVAHQTSTPVQNIYSQLANIPPPMNMSGYMTQAMQGLQPFVDNEPRQKKTKSPFKKGDRVEVIESYLEEVPAGSLGTIDSNSGTDAYVFIDGTESEYCFSWANLKLYNKPKVTIDSVILRDEKKEEIRAAISQQEHATTIFDKWGFGTVFEKGTAISLLFWGVPGTGKTLMAQAIADEFDADLKIYATADIQSSEPGGAERMIRTIFREASKHNRAKGRGRVILFDECDSLLMDRNEIGPILGAEVNALLTEIERYEGIVIFTTNRLGKLDPALERRLSAKIEFEFPDKKARLAIWQRMIPKQAPLHTDVNFDKLANHSIAGGNIKNAVLNAARFAAYKGEDKIAHTHFEDAVKREVASQKAFQDEYKKQTHTTQHGYARSEKGLTVNRSLNKSMSINKTLQMGAKDEDI